MIRVTFAGGTLEVRGLPPDHPAAAALTWDARTDCHRVRAQGYAELILALVRAGTPHEDTARRYGRLETPLVVQRAARPYQDEALAAWRAAQGRGVVVLPTGAGKSHVAVMAIADRARDTLVVAPTLDLVRQWHDLLAASFGCAVGVVGGGEHDVRPLTVTTYDSAHLHMDHLGGRFGLVVFDECHHLPGPTYGLAAEAALAPYRLGLTATPERADGRESELVRLIGPTVYRRDIIDLGGGYLAEYDVHRVEVALSAEERLAHDEARGEYLGFIRAHGIRMGSPQGWRQFLMLASRTPAGMSAIAAHRRQRELAFGADAKLDQLDRLLRLHRAERTLVFTEDNATAYRISRRFLVPVITHQTRVRERSAILRGFSSGAYGVVATSKVLNEGVDVPEASVAVIVSGSGSVREHVQRLGRILRPQDGKRARLYELVSAGTGEGSVSERRREHSAYR